MLKNATLCGLIVFVLAMPSVAYAGKVELTTYYPSPSGEYNTLESNTLKLVPKTPPVCNAAAEGTMYYDMTAHQVKVCGESASWSVLGGNAPGMIAPFAMSSAPAGWLVCNGAAVSRATYAGLFAAIGTTYGSGDGTTFNLPDYRGYFLRGLGGVDPDAGRILGSIQQDTFKSHKHTVGYADEDTGDSGFIAVKKFNDTQMLGSIRYRTAATDYEWDAVTRTVSGGGGSEAQPVETVQNAETRPKNRSVLYCIKY